MDISAARGFRQSMMTVPAAFFLLLFLAGAAMLVYFSVWTFDKSIRVSTPDFTLENYTNFIGDPFYYQFLWRTVRIAFLVTVICLVLAYPVAYMVARARNVWAKRGLLTVVIVTALMGVVNRTYAWLIILGGQGPIVAFLQSLGIEPPQMLFNEFAVVVGLCHRLLPFMIIFISIAIENIPVSLEDASRSLGESPLRTFFRVVLPLSAGGAFAGSLFVFGLSASDFVMPSLLGGLNVKMISNLIYDSSLVVFNFPFGSAMAVILLVFLTLFMATIFLIYHLVSRRRSTVNEAVA